MKRTAAILCLSLFLLAACARAATADGLYQYSTIDALLAGLYDGGLTAGQLKARGDFGLGTFNTLDGEMVMLDGVVYHAKAGGSAEAVPDSAGMPFAAPQLLTHRLSVMPKPEPSRFGLFALRTRPWATPTPC